MLLRNRDSIDGWNSTITGWLKMQSGDADQQLQELGILASFLMGRVISWSLMHVSVQGRSPALPALLILAVFICLCKEPPDWRGVEITSDS